MCVCVCVCVFCLSFRSEKEHTKCAKNVGHKGRKGTSEKKHTKNGEKLSVRHLFRKKKNKHNQDLNTNRRYKLISFAHLVVRLANLCADDVIERGLAHLEVEAETNLQRRGCGLGVAARKVNLCGGGCVCVCV